MMQNFELYNLLNDKINRILSKYINSNSKVINIGFDKECLITKMLVDLGANVTIVDKKKKNLSECTLPAKKICCDAKSLPFEQKIYDIGVLSYLLHEVSAKEQKQIIDEVMRICKRIIVIEPLPRKEVTNRKLEILIDKVLSKHGFYENFRSIQYWKGLIGSVQETHVIETKLFVKVNDAFIENMIKYFEKEDVLQEGKEILYRLKDIGLELQDRAIFISDYVGD